MSNFTCLDAGIYKIKKSSTDKSSPSKASNTGKNIERFVDAHANGIRNGRIGIKNGKPYKLDRNGVPFHTVLRELQNTKIKQKTKHYIWYIFPQPPYKGYRVSMTSRYFNMDEEEVELFLLNDKLRNNLGLALSALEKKGFNAEQLGYYFTPQGDNYKFASFREFFLEVIPNIKKKKSISKSIQVDIQRIEKMLIKLEIDTK